MIIDLACLPKEAVYAVVDEVARTYYINYTTSMGSCLARLYELERPGTTLELRVLVVTSDLTTLKLHTEYYRNMYRDAGYSEMVEGGRKTLQYKVRMIVAPGFKYVDVELVSARGKGMMVARFNTKDEARDFILVHYGSDNPYRLPVYSLNSLTREVLATPEVREFIL